jgi:hypothetical protein
MKYTVWRHDVLLGRTDLAMPSVDPATRAGQLETTLEFAGAWAEFGPTVEEFFAAGAAVGNSVADMPAAAPGTRPADRARQVYIVVIHDAAADATEGESTSRSPA